MFSVMLPPKYSRHEEVNEKMQTKLATLLDKSDLRSIYQLLDNFALLDPLIPHNNYDSQILLETLLYIGEVIDDQGILLSLGAHCFAAAPAIKQYAAKEIVDKLFPKIQRGLTIAAFAATEDEAGSDVMALQTTYTTQGDYFILNGKKSYITNACIADYYIVFASKNIRLYNRGISAFLIPKDVTGLTIQEIPSQNNNVLKNAFIGNIVLENVKIPRLNLLGKECHGAIIFNNSLKLERLFILIPHIGIIMKWFNRALDHAKSRVQFNKPLIDYQMTKEKLIELYRQLVYCYILAKDAMAKLGQLSEADISLVKLTISEALLKSHQEAIKIFGASGLLQVNNISNNIIDSFASSIYSGTSDIQKLIIATQLVSE